MKPLLAFVVCIFSASAIDAYACSCAWGGPFFDVFRNAELTVAVRVDRYGPKLDHGTDLYESMEVTVLEVLLGQEKARKIRIYGDPGNLCRPYISPERFVPGAEYVLALNKLSRPSTYQISICGEYWLRRQDNDVAGHITSNTSETMPYPVFRNELANRGKSNR